MENIPPKLEQSAPGGLHPMEETPTGAVCEELQSGGRTQTGEDCGGLSCGRDSAGAEEECEEPFL